MNQKLTLTLDTASCVVICKALKTFSERLYSGDQAGRILRAQSDYIRCYLEEALEQDKHEYVLPGPGAADPDGYCLFNTPGGFCGLPRRDIAHRKTVSPEVTFSEAMRDIEP